MKKLKRITSLIAAAAVTLSMAAVNVTAAEGTASDTLLNRSREFRVDDQLFTKKYASAVQRIESNQKYFDLSIDPSYQYNDEVNIDYSDYMTIREKINDVYSRYNFSKTEYTFGEGASSGAGYDMVRCDVDGDEHYSYYDYCCMLRYIQNQLGITDEDTDFTVNSASDKLIMDKDEASIYLKKIKSDKSDIVLPAEICCKVKVKDGNGALIDSWCILPVTKIQNDAFSECSNMTSLTIKNYIQPKWYKMIESLDEDYTLIDGYGQASSSAYIDIADGAFNGCGSLTKFNFPVYCNFSNRLFNNTSLNNLEKENGIYYAVSRDENGNIEAKAACGVYDAELAVSNDNDIYSVNIAGGTTTITNNLKAALYVAETKGLYSLNLPSDVKFIYDRAFNGYRNLKYVNSCSYEYLDPATREFISHSNCAFDSTSFITDAVNYELKNAVAEINDDIKNSSVSDGEQMKTVEAICRYIFKNSKYRSYHAETNQFDLFPNGEYNTINENRRNIYVSANAFLSKYTMCESFAKATAVLLGKFGIENFITGMYNWGHAYNHAYIDNKWYKIELSGNGHYNCDYDKYVKLNPDGKLVSNEVGFNNDAYPAYVASCDELLQYGDTMQITNGKRYPVKFNGSNYVNYTDNQPLSKVTVYVTEGEEIPEKFNNDAYEVVRMEKMGWKSEGDKWYWYDTLDYTDITYKYTDKFIRVGGINYYLDENGELATNRYVKWRGYYFYANENGGLNVSELLEVARPAFDSCVKIYS